MERISLSEAECIEALRDALGGAPEADEGLSVWDMMATTGRGANTIRAALRKLMAEGKLEVGQRPNMRLDGRKCLTPVYRVKP